MGESCSEVGDIESFELTEDSFVISFRKVDYTKDAFEQLSELHQGLEELRL